MQGYVCHLQGEVLEEIQHHYPLDLLMALSDAAVGAMQASVLWSDEALMLSPGLPLRAIVIILDAPMLQGLYMRSKRYLLSFAFKSKTCAQCYGSISRTLVWCAAFFVYDKVRAEQPVLWTCS